MKTSSNNVDILVHWCTVSVIIRRITSHHELATIRRARNRTLLTNVWNRGLGIQLQHIPGYQGWSNLFFHVGYGWRRSMVLREQKCEWYLGWHLVSAAHEFYCTLRLVLGRTEASISRHRATSLTYHLDHWQMSDHGRFHWIETSILGYPALSASLYNTSVLGREKNSDRSRIASYLCF
jgi:hypothetical protein